MEQDIKQQLIQSVNSIQTKIKNMKNEENQTDLTMSRLLKPITVPIKALVENSYDSNKKIYRNKNTGKVNLLHNTTSSSEQFQDLSLENTFIEEKDADANDSFETSASYEEDRNTLFNSLLKDDLYDVYDDINIPCGVRSQDKNLFMGNSKVILSKSDTCNDGRKFFITINSKCYELTPGLKELLLSKKPDLGLVSENDKIQYKNMLCVTNAHRRDYHPDSQIKGDKSAKYREIIKPLFKNPGAMEKLGGNLTKFKSYRSNTDLVYWDDPNELIERLQLLIASKDAGNTNHDNEILSIIEELKEAGIIKE